MLLTIKYPSGHYLGDKKVHLPKQSKYFDGDYLNEDFTLHKRSEKIFLGIGKDKTVYIPRLNEYYSTYTICLPNYVYTVKPEPNNSGKVIIVQQFTHIQSIDSQLYMKLFFPELNYTPKEIDLTPVMTLHKELENHPNPINVMSIDPGVNFAKDVDDAISFEIKDDMYLHVSVHIADVSRYLDCYTDDICMNVETIYTTTQVYHMLPIELMKMCSLNENENHYAVTIEFVFNLYDKTYISHNIYRSIVRNIHSMTYDEADRLISADSKFDMLFNFINNLSINENKTISSLFQRTSFYYIDGKIVRVNNNTPSHILIEKLMILANHYVHQEVVKNGEFLIHRFHPASEIEPTKITDVKKALYSPKSGHYALGLDIYNHFTSPIRRYMDVCIHRSLFNKKVQYDFSKEESLEAYNHKKELIKLASRTEYTFQVFRYLTSKIGTDFEYQIIDIKEKYYQIYLPEVNLYTTFSTDNELTPRLKLTGVNLVKLRLYF